MSSPLILKCSSGLIKRKVLTRLLQNGYCTGALSAIRPDLDNYAPASNLALNEKIRQMMQDGHKVYHFAFGQSPFPVLPALEASLVEHVHANDYMPVAGLPEFKDALCKFHYKYDKFTWMKPNQYIVAPGSKQLIFLALLVFSGDIYLPGPSWTTYRPQCVLAGHSNPHIIRTSYKDGWKITPDVLDYALTKNGRSGKRKMLIINNPDNPTGASYTGNELSAISDVLRKHDCIVISDEIYARLHYTDQHISLAHYYPEGTIVSTGMSKWASAGGWRIGYHIYPEELLPTLYKYVHSAASHSHSCCPAPMQHAAAHTLSDHAAECDRYINTTSKILSVVGEYCHRELTSVGVECHLPHAGYYIFPNFDHIRRAHNKASAGSSERHRVEASWSGQQFVDDLFKRSHVSLMSGETFLRSGDEWSARLCYVNFNGGRALDNVKALEGDAASRFLQEYCGPVVDGIQAIKSYIQTSCSH